jgi:hypothetical protein
MDFSCFRGGTDSSCSSPPPPPTRAPDGSVTSWRVSEAGFADRDLLVLCLFEDGSGDAVGETVTSKRPRRPGAIWRSGTSGSRLC